MNRDINKIERSKLIRELEYLTLDIEWKREMIDRLNPKFENSVSEFINMNPNIKEAINPYLFEDYENEELSVNLDDKNFEEQETPIKKEKDPKVKSLYKEISKSTHPDKANNKILNEFYLRSKIYYDNNDLFGLLIICENLNIEFELTETETSLLVNKIIETKEKLNFLESSFTWKWIKNENTREHVIVDYLEKKIK